tara:strand:+ start:823 stop:1206 length:384 start_codon:yes stop_codon:yes gene_type:complete
MFKIVFLLHRSNHRKETLNNFSRFLLYGNILILSFSGPILSYIGKYIQKLNIFKCILIDGFPLIKNKKNVINIWFGGTNFKIATEFKNLKNNFVNMKIKLKNMALGYLMDSVSVLGLQAHCIMIQKY